jgi:hypothetical protein
MEVYLYVYICKRIHIYMNVNIYVYVYMCIHIGIHIAYIYMFICIPNCVNISKFMYMIRLYLYSYRHVLKTSMGWIMNEIEKRINVLLWEGNFEIFCNFENVLHLNVSFLSDRSHILRAYDLISSYIQYIRYINELIGSYRHVRTLVPFFLIVYLVLFWIDYDLIGW